MPQIIRTAIGIPCEIFAKSLSAAGWKLRNGDLICSAQLANKMAEGVRTNTLPEAMQKGEIRIYTAPQFPFQIATQVIDGFYLDHNGVERFVFLEEVHEVQS